MGKDKGRLQQNEPPRRRVSCVRERERLVRTANEAECPCSSSGQLPFEATAIAADQMPKSCITFRSAPASFCPAIIGQSIDANVVNENEKEREGHHRHQQQPPACSINWRTHKLARYCYGQATLVVVNFETNQARTRT